jgi:hypothetical protein
MKIITTTTLFLALIGSALAQEKRTTPKHPKGNPAMQMEALVFYNRAVDFHKANEITAAKMELKKAVNTDFALTEAQLFLADIYYEEGMRDSAFYFYVSGLDFIIEQEAHYFFKLFELGMELGEYSIVHQYLKYFKKVHGVRNDLQPYELGYRYTVEDYDLYKKSIDLVYDYKTWQSAFIENSSEKTRELRMALEDEVYSLNDSRLSSSKEVSRKSKSVPNGMKSFFINSSGDWLIFAKEKQGIRHLYLAQKKRNEWVEVSALPNEINNADWVSDAFYLEKEGLLYFSSNLNGNKDLFVAEYDLVSNKVKSVEPLSRINTPKDECSPSFHENTFYFSTNGYPGLGGLDVFYAKDNEIINGIIYPINPFPMKAGINTNQNDLYFSLSYLKNAYVSRVDKDGVVLESVHFKQKDQPIGLYYEIRLQDLN